MKERKKSQQQLTNEFETTPITGVALVAPEDLPEYGFSAEWTDNVMRGFPDTPLA